MERTGSIYKLTNGELNYYGYTTQSLKKRLHGHNCKDNHRSSKELYKSGKPVTIHLCETVTFTDLKTIQEIEKKYINENECVNILKYNYDNKAYQREYQKTYKKQHRKVSCELCGAVTTKQHLPRHQRTPKCLKNSKKI